MVFSKKKHVPLSFQTKNLRTIALLGISRAPPHWQLWALEAESNMNFSNKIARCKNKQSHKTHRAKGFPKIGIPQNGWFIKENHIKMDDLGVPLFSETSWWRGLHLFQMVWPYRCVGGQPVFSLQFGAQCCYHWPCCTCLAQGSEKCPRGDGLEADQMLVVLPNPVIW